MYWNRCICVMVVVAVFAANMVAAEPDWPASDEVVNLAALSANQKEALRRARSLDYEYVGPTRGNQLQAIAAYRRYLEMVPDDDANLVLNPMARISFLYGMNFVPDNGDEAHYTEASKQCQRVISFAESRGIISLEVALVRQLYMGCTMNRMDRVRRIEETLRWREGISDDDIVRNLQQSDFMVRYRGEKWGSGPGDTPRGRFAFAKVLGRLDKSLSAEINVLLAHCPKMEVIREIASRFTPEELGPAATSILRRRLKDESDSVFETIEDDLLEPYEVSADAPSGDVAEVPTTTRPAATGDLSAGKPAHRPGSRWLIGVASGVGLVGLVVFGLVIRKGRNRRGGV